MQLTGCPVRTDPLDTEAITWSLVFISTQQGRGLLGQGLLTPAHAGFRCPQAPQLRRCEGPL